MSAVRVLGRIPSQQIDDLRSLADLLIPQTPLELQLAAIDTIGRLAGDQVSERLLCGWTQHGPRVHAAVVAVLLWRQPWLGALHDEVETRPEMAAALDWARRDIALRHGSSAIRKQAEKLTESPTPKPDIQQAVENYLPALRMQGDAVRGKQVFIEATCANCHKLQDVGRHVGTDLSRLVDRSLRTLLIDTLDPNRIVDHRFLEYTICTTQGRLITGMMLDESSNSITLADAKGEPHVVLRDDVEELVSSNRSQMPEKLEANLTLQQMADLLTVLATSQPTDGP